MNITSCALTVRGLTVTDRRGHSPLRDFDFDAHAGEIVALVGPSGSGKTTAVSAFLGALPDGSAVTGGSVEWSGAGSRGSRQWRRSSVGYAAQDPSSVLHPGFPAWRSVAEAARMRGYSRAAAISSAREILRELGLADDRIDSLPHRLSGGQAQRVAVARALVAAPELVILDEPTSGLDDVSLEPALAAIAARRHVKGVTIVVTHDRRMSEVCDRILSTAPASSHPLTSAAKTIRPGTSALELTEFGISTQQGSILLEGVEMSVGTGELVVLRGPSGCGKTTLLRAVCGLHDFDGTMRLGGRVVPSRVGDRPAEVRTAIALVGQNPKAALNPTHTVERILRRHIAHVRPHEDGRAEAARLLARVAVPSTSLHRRPHELSGGQRQRVAIARALAGRPRLLVADELTASLDHDTAAVVGDLLDELRQPAGESTDGMAILAATHDEHLTGRADRVVELYGRSTDELPQKPRSNQP